ncbi:PHA/PHB synthase family protein [Halioxenophilus sp. WMMB6]|uniref:PHA/PHB synthase family protein n=1 Tax=Halioxenophilus sp. WMMB6 TaxID=3073815 RepID=UPI00295EE746|nr:alpha/beta fold hydrolase [Halioxenophilus sp. WMMB6]
MNSSSNVVYLDREHHYPKDLSERTQEKLKRVDAIWPFHRYLEELSEIIHAPSKLMGDQLDRSVHATMAKLTMGISPASVLEAYADWASHLAISPGKQWRLLEKSINKNMRLLNYATCSCFWSVSEPCIKPLDNDPRFSHTSWQVWPYNLIHQNFLLTQQWWYKATTGVRGVSKHHENMVEFGARQLLDMLSPSNFLPTNPQVQMQTWQEGGANLVRGFHYWLDDMRRASSGQRPAEAENFKVGENLATTPGKVVFRNRLIELIQYQPATEQVKPEPILVVPAWIMKYYILDLSPENSFYKYLTEQGYTVFTISWHNPTSQDRELTMEDYRTLGIEAALDAIEKITGQKQAHAVGYCLGGTLLSIAAATQARAQQERFKSICLLAAQTDFSEAGELMLFIDQSQITFLEDMMWHQGVLDNSQMAGAFQMLRSNDLVWSRLVHEYMMGEKSTSNDLMAWNSDATRMPYCMHSHYLRHLFLNNELSQGHYLVDGRPISITDIRAPIFCVGTEKDHVAPWKSVYKIHILSDTEVTFVLTKGGHNAGIVSEPGHPRRHYRVSTRSDQDVYLDPDHWLDETPVKEGSWWLEYADWLEKRSGEPVAPPAMGAPKQGLPLLGDAPGTYIFET